MKELGKEAHRGKDNDASLNRITYVYIRQSTLAQLQRNVESRRAQARLVERAHAFATPKPIIDKLRAQMVKYVSRCESPTAL